MTHPISFFVALVSRYAPTVFAITILLGLCRPCIGQGVVYPQASPTIYSSPQTSSPVYASSPTGSTIISSPHSIGQLQPPPLSDSHQVFSNTVFPANTTNSSLPVVMDSTPFTQPTQHPYQHTYQNSTVLPRANTSNPTNSQQATVAIRNAVSPGSFRASPKGTEAQLASSRAVSYTHLTLPTILLV